MIILNKEEYRKKLLGCWMGKNIGGTLGAPVEWRRQINHFTFYTQDLGGEPMPNDDLDIQLVWLIALEDKGLDIDALTLAEYWAIYVTPFWSEYGVAKVNMNVGLLPPLTGSVNNPHKDSCGAFIRSEIWACIAPGRPDLAAGYAYEDAIIDHGNGEGTYGEVFCAALESAAFLISDLRELIRIGLSYIPEHCGVAASVRLAVDCVDQGKTWQEARDAILRLSRGVPHCLGPDDIEKGFGDGKMGYEAPSNIAIAMLGLLYGGDDFGKIVCTAVNCGEDTDCTAATAGAIYGIIHGIDHIPEKWVKPLGRKIKTACVNLGPLGKDGIFGGRLPQTIDELADRTAAVAMQMIAMGRSDTILISDDAPADRPSVNPNALASADHGASLYVCVNGPKFRFPFFTVALDYMDGPFIRPGAPKALAVHISNTSRVQGNLCLRWHAPAEWAIQPGRSGIFLSVPAFGTGRSTTLGFTIQTDTLVQPIQRLVIELTVESRPVVMLVPVTLLNGCMQGKPELPSATG